MRKVLKFLLAVSVVFVLGQTANAAQTDMIRLSVTIIASLSVDVQSTGLAFGNVSAGGAAISTSTWVKNDGQTTEKYTLQLTEKPSAWSAVSGVPGYNQFKLQALFTTTASPAAGNFSDANDIVPTTPTAAQEATATNFAIDTEGVDAKGYACTVNAMRSLFFRFVAPSGTSLTTEQYLTVTVTALQN